MLCYLPVVMIADLIADGLQSGWRVLRRPTIPATWGHDMDVPDMAMKGTLRLSKSNSVGLTAAEYAAIMFTPGAVTSGYKIKNKKGRWKKENETTMDSFKITSYN